MIKSGFGAMLIRWPQACTQNTLPYKPTQSRWSRGGGVPIWWGGRPFSAQSTLSSPAYPALPAAHDGAVQEVLAHGGPQHPQQQTHQQEAGTLPEGEALAPGAGSTCILVP